MSAQFLCGQVFFFVFFLQETKPRRYEILSYKLCNSLVVLALFTILT